MKEWSQPTIKPFLNLLGKVTSKARKHPWGVYGLVRWFFKRGDFEGITDKMANRVKFLLNRRPRKTLDYATPQEKFFK